MEVIQKPHLHASWIDPEARDIVRVLQKDGFQTYLVGGCVRDLLAGLHPKDYDIATSALPNQVRKKIWGSYVIGRRFRLVLVKRGDQQFEVATFRRGSRPEDFVDTEEQPVGDNFFGTPEEDALRRDFTINALFYDPIKDELIDFANGKTDIESCMIRMIGDPAARIIEDPIRSLRAIRLSHKLKFSIESSLRSAILQNAAEVSKSAAPRRREEYLKILRLPEPALAWLELYDLGIIHHVLPSMVEIFQNKDRLETFLYYLSCYSQICWQPQDPVETWAPLILAWSQAMTGTEDFENRRDVWMRMELGVFKSEQVEVLHAMQLAQSFPDIHSFLKRGHRRKNAFLSQPHLSLALRLSRLEKNLNPQDQRFWENSFLNLTQSDHKPGI